jgi:hypothetical protein
VKRRSFLSNALTCLGALPRLAKTSPAQFRRPEDVKEVLVMFKCHLDVGFVDTQAAIIHKYFAEYYPRAIETADKLHNARGDRYIWTHRLLAAL